MLPFENVNKRLQESKFKKGASEYPLTANLQLSFSLFLYIYVYILSPPIFLGIFSKLLLYIMSDKWSFTSLQQYRGYF